MMLDLDAPIVPGRSAAGIDLSCRISDILEEVGHLFIPDPYVHSYFRTVTTRYRSESVDLWEEDGMLRQIGVHGAYRGKLMGRIGIGSTIEEVQTTLGECQETDEDNLAIQGVAGLVFDAEGAFPPAPNGVDFSHPSVRYARVTAFYVFKA